jgi:hypothetical protein
MLAIASFIMHYPDDEIPPERVGGYSTGTEN